MKFVQFSDDTKSRIVAVFSNEQDPVEYPYQAEVEDTDLRYTAFLNRFSGPEVEARRKREGMLIASDWSVLPDSPLSLTKQDAWKIYRQDLRDVPAQSGFPNTIIWPTKPAA